MASARASEAGAPAGGPARRRRAGTGGRTTPLLLLNLPLVALLVAVVAYPMGYSFWLSLHDYNLHRPASYGFVGLRNYARLASASEFWTSLQVTLVFVAATVVLNLLLGLGLALVANSSLRGRTVLRTLLVLPWAIPAIVNGLMWQWMFNGQVGVVNGLLQALHLIDDYRSWLSDPVAALAILVMAHVWNFTPFTAIFLLAALQAIPAELHEVAAVDGANRRRRFWHVTLPWLASALLVVVLLQTIYSLRVFDLVYVLTGGGPGDATNVMSWAAYHQAFTALNFGGANAHAYVIAAIGLVPALLYVGFLMRRTEVEA